ncbi:hypothetical protein ACFSO7_13030 [Bacillus sp. CGMCC 1.16607]|uniref:hypothetical protein n=1 Tax=Bacillus sp. CGMCC 1.16607 TaxID=3351842 RepID=UPI0036429352
MTIEKFQKLHKSVQKLETVLQEVWSSIDEIEQDKEFKTLKSSVKKQKTDRNLAELNEKLVEFENMVEQIPEDGGVAIDFEDAILELIEWLKEKK